MADQFSCYILYIDFYVNIDFPKFGSKSKTRYKPIDFSFLFTY